MMSLPNSVRQRLTLREAIPPNVDEARTAAAITANEQIAGVVALIQQDSAALSVRVGAVVIQIPRTPAGILTILDTVTDQIAVETAIFAGDATATVALGQEIGVEVGAALIDTPLVTAGIEFGLPQASLQVIDTLKDFSANLIRNISDAARTAITVEIQLAGLGVQSIDQTIANIQALLPPSGTGGGIATRAEAIVRTEVGRVHSFAAQERLEAMLEQVPDLQKEWRHSGRILNARDGHVAASGQRVPVAERFRVAPTVGGTKQSLLFPRDPVASAANSVFCRCTVIPWLERWEDAA